jgi:pimeloyl-ACP methyl ester carboxylesterase
MKRRLAALMAVACLALSAPLGTPVFAQEAEEGGGRRGPAPFGPVASPAFRTTYVRLGREGDGLLYEPTTISAKTRIGIVFSHPGDNNFNAAIGREMASRGYRVVNVNFRGNSEQFADQRLPTISEGVRYLRSLPGVQKVLVAGHSGGGREMALYENVAENGVAACNGPEKLLPCSYPGLDKLQKPDGVIFLDPPAGAFHNTSSIDPAVDSEGGKRNPALDMFTAANGYDAEGKKAKYSADFAKRFYAGQAARANQVIDAALARVKVIAAGGGRYADDEPMVIPGMGINAVGARLYQPDVSFATHSKKPHLLLKADGSEATQIIQSVRPPSGGNAIRSLNTLYVMSDNTTVKQFLSHTAIRLLPNYSITADDIVGVDWRSSIDSAPGNAEGIRQPALVMTMSCHYLIVPGEALFDHLASKDKTYVSVEGATHGFSPCKPEYGNTTKRTFDYVDRWLSQAGRF